MKNVLFSLLLVALFTGCKYVGESSKHFSSQMESVDEPQTDDERTFVEEYNDFLVLADSLADVWDGNDTLTMRRLYHNQRDQQRRVEKMKDRPNIRHSMVEKVLGNVEKIGSEIAQKFSPELCKELYVFHEFFDLNKHSYSDLNVRKVIDGKIYTNSLGEHYLFVRKTYYDLIEGHLHPSDIMTKQPILEKDIDSFKQNYQQYLEYTKRNRSFTDDSYEVGDGKPMQEVELPDEAFASNAVKSSKTNDTDWDATEIDWCEKCQAKNYSCCPKCKDGERSDCECKCETCMNLGNINGL